MTSNIYEREFDKILFKSYPEYFKGLKTILHEFEEHLISNGIIENGNWESYSTLLKQISLDAHKEFKITYDIDQHLLELTKKVNFDEVSLHMYLSNNNLLNTENSKTLLVSQKLLASVDNGKEFNRSTNAKIILDVMDESDFELTQVKLRVFRFLDPNSETVLYKYVGKPQKPQ